MSGISTHVLDTSRGLPASGVAVRLERAEDFRWAPVGRGVTDSDGRVNDLVIGPPSQGRYRLTFETGGHSSFYPEVEIIFEVAGDQDHYHVPLLLSPFGYSTYRGS